MPLNILINKSDKHFFNISVMPAMPGISANKPAFIKGLEPQKVNEGGTIKLAAQLPPDHGCKIKWYELLNN